MILYFFASGCVPASEIEAGLVAAGDERQGDFFSWRRMINISGQLWRKVPKRYDLHLPIACDNDKKPKGSVLIPYRMYYGFTIKVL